MRTPSIVDGRSRSWMRHAACRDQDPEVYDTDDDLYPSPEIRCPACPVRTECLAFALEGRESGTWGGESRKERDKLFLVRKRPRRTCPKCDGTDIHTSDGKGYCLPCAVSWDVVPKNPRTRPIPAEA